MKRPGILALGLFMLVIGSARADFVVGSAGSGWNNWLGTPENAGGEFWDRTSFDGANCNIGYWFIGTATNCKPGSQSGFVPPYGQLPFWGINLAVPQGSTKIANDPSFYFTGNGLHNTTLRLELGGNANFNAFGWYSTSDPGTLHQLFAPSASPIVSTTFTATGDFGYYFTDKTGVTYRSSGSSEQRFALFRESPTGTAGNRANVYWIGVEDLPLTGDKDFNDIVVRVYAVPEPTQVVMGLGLALAMFAFYRKSRKTAVI